jgi:hypothetical protein
MLGDRAYRALLFLYPRRFRREYGDPMVQLYRDARRDGSSWLRCASDVVVSAPVQHKEALRIMSTQGKLVTAAVVATAGIVAFAAVGGAIAAMLLMALLAWILVALLKERGVQPVSGAGWKIAALGAAIFVLAFAFFASPWPESWREAVPGELAWGVGFFVFVMSIVMVVVGMLLGITGHFTRRRLTQ